MSFCYFIDVSTSDPPDNNTVAIIGGAVAIVFILAIAAITITVIALAVVVRERHRNISPQQQ